MSASQETTPQEPPYYRIVPKQMWTAECVHCGRDIFSSDSEYCAWSDENTVSEVLDAGECYWRCKCGAPLNRQEAELLAEGDPPHRWEHREPPLAGALVGGDGDE